jgi:tight adherence protein B
MRKLSTLLIQAGMTKIQPAQFVLILLASSGAFLVLMSAVTSSVLIGASITICVLVQLVDSFRSRIRTELYKTNLEWPKFLDSIHSAAWAGASLEQAILDSISFAPAKLSWALLEFEKDQNSSLPLSQNLDNLKARLANPIADRFIEITRLASASGGRGYLNALRNQALQLRLENATWTEIQVKQNWILGTAKLAVLAPWLVLVLLSLRPETAIAFQSETGIAVLVIGLVASLLAFRFIKALGSLPQRSRTLAL